MRVWRTIGAILFLVAAAELVLRFGVGLGDPPLAVLDDHTEYELPGPRTYQRWHNRISINAQGMRAEPLNAGEVRLLLLGDSVVYGGHFLDQEETIAYRMEAMLAEQGCAVRVLPVAVSSWGPDNLRGYLSKYGTHKADWTILLVSAHDLYDVPQEASQILPYRTRSAWFAFEDAMLAVHERLWPVAKQRKPRSIEDRQAITMIAMAEITALLREAGSGMSLVYHPTVPERENGVYPQAQVFADWARNRRVPFFDLGNVAVRDADYRDDIHPTSSGADEIARALVGYAKTRSICTVPTVQR